MQMSDKTSCSDNGVYPRLCGVAASDDRIFSNFRRDSVYGQVVETVSRKAGRDYLNNALLQNKNLETYFGKFRKNDLLGNPQVFKYRYGVLKLKRIVFSPTTLRYIKVLADLQALFGSLDGMRIVEIGGGYGGQCAVVSSVCQPAAYTLIDLEPCLKLARRYLGELGTQNVHYATMADLGALSGSAGIDLVISNYAFTELARSVQTEYVQKVISRAARGYFLCNLPTHTWEAGQYSEQEIATLRPHTLVFKQYPPLADLDIDARISLIVFGAQCPPKWAPE